MKSIALFFLCVVVTVECNHLFFGTNVNRVCLYHKVVEYNPGVFQRSVRNLHVTIPPFPNGVARPIQGVMAFDMTYSGASAAVTQGGLGFNFINIMMQNGMGKKLHYDVYVFA